MTSDLFKREKSEDRVDLSEQLLIKQSERVMKEIEERQRIANKAGKRIQIDLSDMLSSYSQGPQTPVLHTSKANYNPNVKVITRTRTSMSNRRNTSPELRVMEKVEQPQTKLSTRKQEQKPIESYNSMNSNHEQEGRFQPTKERFDKAALQIQNKMQQRVDQLK